MTPEVSGEMIDATERDPVAEVQAWRARGEALRDPVAFGVTLALARRAAAQHGPARQLLLRRVDEMLQRQSAAPQPPARPAVPPSAALAGLSALVDRLGRTATPRPLKAVGAFKGTWSRLRAEQRLRQALAQVPAKAGPLNSSHVLHRALQTLHTLSPAYLDTFMAHVDNLLWLEQASGGGDPAWRAPASRKR